MKPGAQRAKFEAQTAVWRERAQLETDRRRLDSERQLAAATAAMAAAGLVFSIETRVTVGVSLRDGMRQFAGAGATWDEAVADAARQAAEAVRGE